MTLSRRLFLNRAATSVLAAPTVAALSTQPAKAAVGQGGVADLSMGFPVGALRMGFNENVLGPSPRAVEAGIAGVRGSYRYALPNLLQPMLAEHHGLDKDWVLPGNGSTEILMLAPITFMRDGGNLVTALETWDGMLNVADALGVKVKRIGLRKDKGYAFDIDAMIAAIDPDTRLFMLVSPNNPTGSTVTYADMKRVADALPPKAILVIDHAYADYLPEQRSGIDLLREGRRNVLVTRTFSKAHALAGLRCGYGMAHPDILSEMKKFGCGYGNVNIAAYGAIQASLADVEHIAQSKEHMANAREYFARQCRALGLEIVAGVSPFAMVNVGAARSPAIKSELQRRNIFIAHGDSWHMPDYLRVSYGRDGENKAFFENLRAVV